MKRYHLFRLAMISFRDVSTPEPFKAFNEYCRKHGYIPGNAKLKMLMYMTSGNDVKDAEFFNILNITAAIQYAERTFSNGTEKAKFMVQVAEALNKETMVPKHLLALAMLAVNKLSLKQILEQFDSHPWLITEMFDEPLIPEHPFKLEAEISNPPAPEPPQRGTDLPSFLPN